MLEYQMHSANVAYWVRVYIETWYQFVIKKELAENSFQATR